ncbi:hypothetical protein BH11MYX3_BH11MYX3_00390 [soil metagenome]
MLLLASTAGQASTARPRPHPPKRANLAHAVLEAIDDDHATLSFVLTSNSRQGKEVIVPIDLPEGMTATGMTLAMGRAAGDSGVALVSEAARRTYDSIVRMIKDPALLEWTSEGRLQLSVFPVVKGTPARVTIELTATSEASNLNRVTRQLSLLASPEIAGHSDPYADYWPEHRTDEVVASAEPSGRLRPSARLLRMNQPVSSRVGRG